MSSKICASFCATNITMKQSPLCPQKMMLLKFCVLFLSFLCCLVLCLLVLFFFCLGFLGYVLFYFVELASIFGQVFLILLGPVMRTQHVG